MVPTTVPGDSVKVPAGESVKTILFADDNGQLQKRVAESLCRYGYNLIVAGGGKDALQKAREFTGIIHLLLSDVDMSSMTGIDLAIQLNRERPDTRVLLIAGRPTILLLNNGWQFLMKPFMADMLRDRIRDVLSEQPLTKSSCGTPDGSKVVSETIRQLIEQHRFHGEFG